MLTVAFLLLAGAFAAAQDDDIGRTYGWRWAVGGQDAGSAKSWNGGDLRIGADDRARHADVRVTLPVTLAPVVRDWLGATSAGGSAATRDVHLLELTRDGSVARATLYKDATITELSLPALSGDELDVEAFITIAFAPNSVQVLAQPPVIAAAAAPALGKETRPTTFTKDFSLSIDGLAGKDVNKIGAITWRSGTGKRPVTNIVLSLLERAPDIDAWKAWFDASVVQKAQAPKNGTLALGAGNDIKFSVGLTGLRMLRMTRAELNNLGNAGAVIRYEIELACQGLTTPGGSPPATGAAIDKPAAPREPGAGAPHADDKGARDPEGVPRFAGSVRTSYASTETRTYVDATATYSTKVSDLRDVEPHFKDGMPAAGWTFTGRSEGGDKTTAWVEMRWEKGEKPRQQLKVTLGIAKDGTITIQVKLLTLAR